jgi:hypothetical protein
MLYGDDRDYNDENQLTEEAEKVEKFPVPESKSWEFIITTTIAVSKELYQEQKKVHF